MTRMLIWIVTVLGWRQPKPPQERMRSFDCHGVELFVDDRVRRTGEAVERVIFSIAQTEERRGSINVKGLIDWFPGSEFEKVGPITE